MKVLKFYAEWCGPCKRQSLVIAKAKEKISITIENVNIDDNIFMAQDFKVRSVPTLVMVDETGTEVKRHLGVLEEEQLLEFLKG
jgi:thioredoxin 1